MIQLTLRSFSPRFRPHVQIAHEQGLQEPVLGDVDQLEEVGAEGVTVLVEESPVGKVKDSVNSIRTLTPWYDTYLVS